MMTFSQKDIQQIEDSGLALGDVERQWSLYQQGANFLELNRPCDLKDGILSFTPAQRKKLVDLFEEESGKFKLLKFVPASGAASRMFAQWYAIVEQDGVTHAEKGQALLRDLKKMPFYSLIDQLEQGQLHLERKDVQNILKFILLPEGLNFGWLPKALIPFHQYAKNEIRTALEEHLYEAVHYVCDEGKKCLLHFTISTEHDEAIHERIKHIQSRYETLFAVKYDIQLSQQSPATNILAVDENNHPFRDDQGNLVFRPGGHGALLRNLSDLDADFIFIKNIDNVAPTSLLKKILPYKKMLGGLALQIQKSVFALLRKMETDAVRPDQLPSIEKFCQGTLNIVLPSAYARLSPKKKKDLLFQLLNRPLRVCGMVRNEGEPGGGPFWVTEKDGTQTLQIVESGHVDKSKPGQALIWSQASFFNPVDMVCCIKSYRGEKFKLQDYVNHDAYLITQKTEKGYKIKAQELPGLWNGCMAKWNTVFVELPLMVFNPVKTVNDLLRPEHTGLAKFS